MATKKRTATANGNNGSKWLPGGKERQKVMRLALYLRDRFTCLYCLRDLHGAAPFDITLDHVKSRANGVEDHRPCNLVVACRPCNSKKKDMPLARFCGPETRAHIRRNTARSMARYIRLAKAILAGEVGDPRS